MINFLRTYGKRHRIDFKDTTGIQHTFLVVHWRVYTCTVTTNRQTRSINDPISSY